MDNMPSVKTHYATNATSAKGVASVVDVAQYILEKLGRLAGFDLQMLAYFCQAQHLGAYGKPLFAEDIQAWCGGPICPPLFRLHNEWGAYRVTNVGGNSDHLSAEAKAFIDDILSDYSEFDSQHLGDLARSADPWRETRRRVHPTERGQEVISHKSMQDFYASFWEDA